MQNRPLDLSRAGLPLWRNDIIVMDNCRVHLVAGVGRPLRKHGRHFAIFRITRPTSTRSSWLTANSKLSCEKLPREQFLCSTEQFERFGLRRRYASKNW